MKHSIVYFILYVCSTYSATGENEVPSKITVKEVFNNPAITNPVSLYGPPPIVSNFVHQGTNFFFNPRFLLGTNIPPPLGAVIPAIPNPNVVEINVNRTILPPQSPPISSVNVTIEEPIDVITLPPPPPPIPVIPDTPEKPVLLGKIPPAPVLPPLVLPKIPVWVDESIKVVPDCPEKEIVITEVKPLPPVIIQEVPSLPALALPPKVILSEIEVKTQSPIEPSTTKVPVVAAKDVSLGFSKVKLTNEESLQLIPGSPISLFDTKINEIPKTNEFTNMEKLVSIDEDKTMILNPPSPQLHVIEISRPITDMLAFKKDKRIILPTDCARDIIVERVLPNMISKKTVTKSLEIVQYPVVAQRFIPAL